MDERPLRGADWDERWAAGDTPWDMGRPSPPLVHALAAGQLPLGRRVLVPGCGSGYELGLLAAAGYDVTGVEISAEAAARATALLDGRERARVVLADALDATAPLMVGGYDWAFEQTFFCAIRPGQRASYGEAMKRWLAPGGEVWAILLRTPYHDRPPYDVPAEAYVAVMAAAGFVAFESRALDGESHPKRRGRETLVRLRLQD